MFFEEVAVFLVRFNQCLANILRCFRHRSPPGQIWGTSEVRNITEGLWKPRGKIPKRAVDGGREVLGGEEGWRERTAQAERDEGIFFSPAEAGPDEKRGDGNIVIVPAKGSREKAARKEWNEAIFVSRPLRAGLISAAPTGLELRRQTVGCGRNRAKSRERRRRRFLGGQSARRIANSRSLAALG